MRHHIVSLFSALLLGASTLAACSGDAVDPSAPEQTNDDSADAASGETLDSGATPATDGGVTKDGGSQKDGSAPAIPSVPDPSFGNNGLVMVGRSLGNTIAFDLAPQPDGSTVLCGESAQTTDYRTWFARVLPSGALDSTFGTSGQSKLGGSAASVAWYCFRQNDGSILGVGRTGAGSASRVLFGKVSTTGAPVSAFGTGGMVTADIPTLTVSMRAFQSPAGDLLFPNNTNVIRYSSAGKPVTSFGSGGTLAMPLYVDDVAIGAQSFHAAGTSVRDATHLTWYVTRRDLSGALDATFGSAGVAVTENVGNCATGCGEPQLVVDSAGRAVVVGRTNEGLVLARFTTSGIKDASFGTNGVARIALANVQLLKVGTVAADAKGRLVVGMQSAQSSSGFSAVRITAAGALDSTFADAGSYAIDLALRGAGIVWTLNAIDFSPQGHTLLVGSKTTKDPQGTSPTTYEAAIVRLTP
jgi:uncharacterized delta-60 repeat protein